MYWRNSKLFESTDTLEKAIAAAASTGCSSPREASGIIAVCMTGHSDSRDNALEELRSAYGRGDLSDEEFETRRRKLEND